MEAILRDSVHHSLRDFLHRNAIFLCERLCAEFPSETNLQLLAGCYLHSNQAYAAYHILKGSKWRSRSLPSWLIYRYTDRRKSAIHHFKQALTIDPSCSAEEAAVVFGEAAALSIQKQYLHHGLASQSLLTVNDDCNLVSGRNFSFEDVSPRQLKLMQGSNTRDSSGNSHVILGGVSGQPTNGSSNISFYNTPSPMPMQLSGIAPPPVCRNVLPNGLNLSSGTDSSPRSTMSSTIQGGRRKFVDEGKLRKVANNESAIRLEICDACYHDILSLKFSTGSFGLSGAGFGISSRLSFDSGNRRSNRLAAEAGANTNASASMAAGNGTTNTSKIGSSKLGSVARSLTSRKGQPWANENLDEGIRNETFDDSRSNTAAISGFTPTSDTRYLEQDGATLSLDALDVYLKLPYKHYNTGWVLCQVGKAYFELLDILKLIGPSSGSTGITLHFPHSPFERRYEVKLPGTRLISTDRLAPQSWILLFGVMYIMYLPACWMDGLRKAHSTVCNGNCYSLQKDHETALKNFQRAVQLNSNSHMRIPFVPWMILRRIKSYQSALRLDARHYNSWFGLGMIYFRQEKFEFAEHHFRTANQIIHVLLLLRLILAQHCMLTEK
ncbi:putative 43kDa postsynaptic protein [Rosa chinensis]|uniref:Putative 43kDa postsynaptic protein n=1 Tax=Rosa chinensis TaxID=74649 RepID=A0A2P6RJR8_ROSCH|nr:putative 43kDa postsynaptic protein [Rosa chinensis]